MRQSKNQLNGTANGQPIYIVVGNEKPKKKKSSFLFSLLVTALVLGAFYLFLTKTAVGQNLYAEIKRPLDTLFVEIKKEYGDIKQPSSDFAIDKKTQPIDLQDDSMQVSVPTEAWSKCESAIRQTDKTDYTMTFKSKGTAKYTIIPFNAIFDGTVQTNSAGGTGTVQSSLTGKLCRYDYSAVRTNGYAAKSIMLENDKKYTTAAKSELGRVGYGIVKMVPRSAESTAVQTKSGITFSLTEEEFRAMYKDILSDLRDMYINILDADDMRFSDTRVTYNIKMGQIAGYSLTTNGKSGVISVQINVNCTIE